MTKKLFRTRTVVAALVILLLMITAYAYAAANTVPETGAGDGQNAISGYTITNVHYSLDSTDPSLISQVSFDINPTDGADDVSEVKVQLEAGGDWFDCVEASAPAVTCDVNGGVTAFEADNFRVVAVQ